MTLSSIAHVKRNQDNDGDLSRPPAPPIASFIASTWDRSGSMASTSGSSGPALYSWVKDACDQARNLGQECFLSATTFDDEAERRFQNVSYKDITISAAEAKAWTEPRGLTRLYDTAVADIQRLRQAAEKYRLELPHAVQCLDPKIVIAWSLMTDGLDNASEVANETILAATVREAREAGCHCYFLAANCDGVERGRQYGFDAQNSLTFEADRQCSDSAFRGISNCLRVATSGSQQTAIPNCVRQCSAPTHVQQHQSAPSSSQAWSSAGGPPTLRQNFSPPIVRGTFAARMALRQGVPVPQNLRMPSYPPAMKRGR